ncbi:MAG: F0F1 ATP synthase subunit delta [Gammaproteobacteria bacterium]|nr:F0F1 ATP synthase subunit delta [Gammaproteobacteria bacterium]
MAENITLARPYANAAFDLADENGGLEEWSEALSAAARAAATEDFSALIGSPHVRPAQLADLLGDVVTRALGGRLGDVELQAGNLFRVMAENRRLNVLPEVSGLFDELKAEKENVLDVRMISATAMSESLKHKFTMALEKKLGRSVRLNCEVDDTIIGGAIIQADDMVIDGSLRGRLEKLATAVAQ